jgi:hypothetical protein
MQGRPPRTSGRCEIRLPISVTVAIASSIALIISLTNGSSKKWENHWAAICLWFGCYNFCRIRQTLRVTPAMEAGLTNRIWKVADLLN